jgi:hypothetical protein
VFWAFLFAEGNGTINNSIYSSMGASAAVSSDLSYGFAVFFSASILYLIATLIEPFKYLFSSGKSKSNDSSSPFTETSPKKNNLDGVRKPTPKEMLYKTKQISKVQHLLNIGAINEEEYSILKAEITSKEKLN